MAEYIKNPEFLEALRTYKTEKEAGKQTSTTYKRAYDKIGLAIKLIAEGLAKKPNFSGYSFIDEMKSDAIENCITYLDNFKVDLDTSFAVVRHIPYTNKSEILYTTTQTTAMTRATKLNNEYKEHHYSVVHLAEDDTLEIQSTEHAASEAIRKNIEFSKLDGETKKPLKYTYQGRAKENQKRTQNSNPFGYFTQICWYAFLRRIEKEKKQSRIKSRMIKESGILDQIITQAGDDSTYVTSYLDTLKAYVDQGSEASEIEDEVPKVKQQKNAMAEFMEEE